MTVLFSCHQLTLGHLKSILAPFFILNIFVLLCHFCVIVENTKMVVFSDKGVFIRPFIPLKINHKNSEQ